MSHHHHMARASALARSTAAARRAAGLAPVVASLRASGATSLRTLAARLTGTGIPAPRDAAWSAMAVRRVLARIEGDPPSQ